MSWHPNEMFGEDDDERAARLRESGRRQHASKVCFLCDQPCGLTTRDTEPPHRCPKCLAAVAMNEADGEL